MLIIESCRGGDTGPFPFESAGASQVPITKDKATLSQQEIGQGSMYFKAKIFL